MYGKGIVSAIIAACVALAVSASAMRSRPQAHGTLTLDAVLDSLNREAESFRSLTADVERTKVTVVVNVKSTETGTLWVRGDKMRLDLKEPDPRTVLRAGDTIFVYTPGLKQVEEYNLGKHRELVNEFLLLGFGTSGHELQKGFLLTLIGEPVLDRQKTALLELTPKAGAARNQIARIRLWLDESSWLPVQQEFFETGTDDYFIIRYANISKNPEIPDSRFKPHWPKGTQRVRPDA
ncbi:MAG: outer-membrane lipoprotein carrier protein LolA [Candidatus Acidiferrales bacterium]